MFRRRLRELAVAVGMAAAIMGLMTAAAANASSRGRSHRPPVVRPRFRYVADANSVWTGARYALARWAASPTGQYATLIDDQTGQVKTISRAGCAPGEPSTLEPPDLPWVTFDCGVGPFNIGPPEPELYSPATGRWQAVSRSPGVSPVCTGTGCTDRYYVEGAGRAWLEYNHATCDSGGQHCNFTDVFQNIATGELRQDPSGGTATVDLNAPNLTRTVCGPLRIPTSFDPYAQEPVPGSLTFYRSFKVAIGGDVNRAEVYLERCGKHLHRLLTTAPLGRPPVVGANAHEVVWMAHPGRFLTALTLPGLRPFTIRLPNRLVARTCSPYDYSTCVAQIALTNQRLYLLTAGPYPEHLWVTPDPRPAQRRRK